MIIKNFIYVVKFINKNFFPYIQTQKKIERQVHDKRAKSY